MIHRVFLQSRSAVPLTAFGFCPIFPLDVTGPCEVVDHLEGADAVVQQVVSDTPIGTIHYVDTFVDGALKLEDME